jgi:spore coat protein U-like protein
MRWLHFKLMAFGRLGGTLFLGLGATVSYAKIGCNGLDFQTASNVNLTSNPSQQLILKVSRNNTNHGCDYFFTFSRGSSSSYASRTMVKGSDEVPYQLYRTFPYSDVLKDLGDAVSNSDVIANTFPDDAGSQQNIESFRATLGTVTYPPVGFYMDSVVIRLYEGTLSSYVLRSSTTVLFQYSATRSIDLSLVASGAAFDQNSTSRTLDFGEMYPGETMGFDIVLKTNAGYSISMQSQNGGAMRHVSVSNGQVPYAMSVGGATVSLGSGSPNVKSGSGASPSDGIRIPVRVSVGELSNSVSGNYRDVITIAVQTTE